VLSGTPSTRLPKVPLASATPGFENLQASVWAGFHVNAKTPDVLVALSGGLGTLSEIAVAVRVGTPVIGLHCPPFSCEGPVDFTAAETVEEVLALIERKLDALRQQP